jgi:hypothetical protein
MIVVAILIVVGVIYGGEALSGNMPYVPQGFTNARVQAAQTSGQIMSDASTSITNLNAISVTYNSGKYDTALDLAIQEVHHNVDERNSEATLSTQLGTMASNLYQLRPSSAEQVGVQAIGEEYQVLEKLVDYSNLVDQLLNELRAGYIDQGSIAALNTNLNNTVGLLNSDAQSINSLNQQYLSLMAKFDTLTK